MKAENQPETNVAGVGGMVMFGCCSAQSTKSGLITIGFGIERFEQSF